MPKIIINGTLKLFLNRNQHFGNNITVSECCLIKLLPCVLFEKYIYILALEMRNGQPSEPALCQLHRHTFVSYFAQKRLND